MPAEAIAERLAALEERARAAPPTTWRPNDARSGHPQLLAGVMEIREPGPDFGYGPHDVVVVRTSDGMRWSVFLMHQVLREEFDRKQPQAGDLVAVKYEGRVAGGQGKSGFEKYRLEVDRTATFAGSSEPRPHASPPAGDACGYADPDHAAGCPNDLPF